MPEVASFEYYAAIFKEGILGYEIIVRYWTMNIAPIQYAQSIFLQKRLKEGILMQIGGIIWQKSGNSSHKLDLGGAGSLKGESLQQIYK